MRNALFVGLGGFTTFSSFGKETMDLWRGGGGALAVVNVASQVVFRIVATSDGRDST